MEDGWIWLLIEPEPANGFSTLSERNARQRFANLPSLNLFLSKQF
jgi:hypothetical protein